MTDLTPSDALLAFFAVAGQPGAAPVLLEEETQRLHEILGTDSRVSGVAASLWAGLENRAVTDDPLTVLHVTQTDEESTVVLQPKAGESLTDCAAAEVLELTYP